MQPPVPCHLLVESLIHLPLHSKREWEQNLIQTRWDCLRTGSSIDHSGGCQINKCLDRLVLEMMQREKQSADIAFSYVYRLYKSDLLECAAQNGCSEKADAKDIVHQVLVEFYVVAQLRPIRLESGSLKTYLCQAVRNKWIDRTRGKFYRGGSTLIAGTTPKNLPQEDSVTDKELETMRRLAQFSRLVFSSLRDTCSPIIRYYFFRLMSYQEILTTRVGSAYGSVEALRNRVSECRKRLVSKLSTDEHLRKLYGDIYNIHQRDLKKEE